MEGNNILEIKNLTVEFVTEDETVQAVNNLSLSLEKGKTIGLVGETGAGKTTTAKAIMHLIPSPPGKIVSGEIHVDDYDMLNASNKDLSLIRGREISMIFQDPMSVLNPVFTVGEQIAECYRIHDALNKKEALEKAKDMLRLVGIPEERAGDYPHQFSGGMKQRVVIAIALACNPKLLIADEPTTALDVTIQAQVLELMKELKVKYNTSMIMITHDLGIVAEVCDSVAIMYAGSIVEEGSLEEIYNHTMHPYTEGLFNSLPNIYVEQEMLKPIKGLMPDPTNLPKGCAFCPRCEYAKEECNKRKPELVSMGGTHKCACLRYEEEGFRIERREEDE